MKVNFSRLLKDDGFGKNKLIEFTLNILCWFGLGALNILCWFGLGTRITMSETDRYVLIDMECVLVKAGIIGGDELLYNSYHHMGALNSNRWQYIAEKDAWKKWGAT